VARRLGIGHRQDRGPGRVASCEWRQCWNALARMILPAPRCSRTFAQSNHHVHIGGRKRSGRSGMLKPWRMLSTLRGGSGAGRDLAASPISGLIREQAPMIQSALAQASRR